MTAFCSGAQAGAAAGEETEDRGEQTEETAAGERDGCSVGSDDRRGARADQDYHRRVRTSSQPALNQYVTGRQRTLTHPHVSLCTLTLLVTNTNCVLLHRLCRDLKRFTLRSCIAEFIYTR